MFNNIIVLIGCSLEGVFRCVLLLQGRQLPIYIQSVLSDYSFRFYPAFSSYLFIPLSASVFFPIFSFPICFRFLRFLRYLLFPYFPYLLPLSLFGVCSVLSPHWLTRQSKWKRGVIGSAHWLKQSA